MKSKNGSEARINPMVLPLRVVFVGVMVIGCLLSLKAEVISARVVQPSICYDQKNGIVGISTSSGDVIDSSGKVIGSVDDYDCTSWKSRRDVPIKTLNKYVLGISSVLFTQSCKTDGSFHSNREVAYAIYLDSNGRLVNLLIGTGDNKKVKVKIPDGLYDRVLAVIHDHPAIQDKSTGACYEGTGCAHLWPSDKDAVAMIKETDRAGFPVHSYILDCHEQGVIRLNAVERKNEKTDANVGAVKRILPNGDEVEHTKQGTFTNAYVRSKYAEYCNTARESVEVAANSGGMKIRGYNFMSPSRSRMRSSASAKSKKTYSKPGTATSEKDKMSNLSLGSARNSGVGIKGWCKCLDKQETCGAKSIEVGAGRDWIGKPGYSYRFCLCCGKCRRPPEKISSASDIKIMDREFYWKVQAAKDDIERNRLIKERLSSVGIKAGDGDTTREAVAAMAVAQIQLMQIPDGQIVIQGECMCKDPDPVNSGYVPDEYVCVSCGKHCENRSGKIGKTAKRLMTKGY